MSDLLRVIYPGGGKKFLLQWWTHNEQHHVILASTQESVYATAKRVFATHKEVKLRLYLEVDVVAPSPKMSLDAAIWDREEGVLDFLTTVSSRLHEAASLGHPLPPEFLLCGKYLPREEMDDDEIKWARKSHYSCQNCTEGICLVGLSPEILYDKYKVAWDVTHPTPKPKGQAPRVVSRAVPAVDGEPLWYCSADFGHHASGVDLQEVVYVKEALHRPPYLSDRILFFFRRVSEVDFGPLLTLLNEQINEQAQKEKRRMVDFKAVRARASQEAAARALKVFQRIP